MNIDNVVDEFIIKERLPKSYRSIALKWFVPLAQTLAKHHSSAGKTLAIGLNGCQGSGKSTLSALLTQLLTKVFDKPSLSMSIDDFYFSRKHRKTLSETIHPLLQTRGVPGTHDTNLLLSSLTALKKQEYCEIPVFDKSIDDVLPKSQHVKITRPFDIVILEGWCVGMLAQDESDLRLGVNELEVDEDPKSDWRSFVNKALKTTYQTVFAELDYLIMLQAPSFSSVYNWRLQQENKLIETLRLKNLPLNKVMDESQVNRFIQHYQRLTEYALDTLPERADTLFTLNQNREIIKCRMT